MDYRNNDVMDVYHGRLQCPGVLDRQQSNNVVDNMERGAACSILLDEEVNE